MQKISTWLWFDTEAEAIANHYTTIFKNGKINDVIYEDPEKTKVLTVAFSLGDEEFGVLNNNNGYAKITPANSLTANCETVDEVNAVWKELTSNDNILVPLDEYPFAKMFGWCIDKYGVSWQVHLGEVPQKISPHLFFTDGNFKRAQEAIDFYVATFKNSKVDLLEKGEAGDVAWSELTLDSFKITMNDLEGERNWNFSDAFSYAINCKDQAEIDDLWDKLVADGGQEMACFWCKDKFGVSWQLIPEDFGEWINGPKGDEVTKAMFKMSKPIIADLLKAME